MTIMKGLTRSTVSVALAIRDKIAFPSTTALVTHHGGNRTALSKLLAIAVGAVLLCCSEYLLAYIPPQPKPYQVVTGTQEQFLLVMLPTCCGTSIV